MPLVTLQTAGNTLKEGKAVTILHCAALRRVGIVVPAVTVTMTGGLLLNFNY